jgi:hypothetical protein
MTPGKLHPWHQPIQPSRVQLEIHEERQRIRSEAARAGRVSASMERVAVEVELSEVEPLPLDSDERDSALVAGLVSGTSPRRLSADE